MGGPPQVVLAAGVAATWTPAGSESVNWAPVSATAFPLVNVKVSVETALTAIGLGENDLPIVGWTAVPQPVKSTLSRNMSEPGTLLPALNP